MRTKLGFARAYGRYLLTALAAVVFGTDVQ
jgi:hypothetical protein